MIGCVIPLALAILFFYECADIKDSIWRLGVSYRLLNSVTWNSEFPIPRCTDSIEYFSDSSGPISSSLC